MGAVNELADWLTGPDPAQALAARNALQRVADHDNPTVAGAAATLLATVNPKPSAGVPTSPVQKTPTHTADPAEAQGMAAEAERVVGTIIDADSKARALVEVARAWAAMDPAQAERVAGTITDADRKARVLVDVARAWAAVATAWI